VLAIKGVRLAPKIIATMNKPRKGNQSMLRICDYGGNPSIY
jgi:hypothetical protein